MEQPSSTPAKWVGQEFTGFVINAAFSEENIQKITTWLDGLHEVAPEGIYFMKPEGLHITVLDWVAPLLNYGGVDKRALFKKLHPGYDAAFRSITNSIPPFDVHFTKLRVTPGTIILVGQDGGQFQMLRGQFMDITTLPEGKQPPNIIHSSLARFVPPEIDLAPIEEYATTHPLNLMQRISEFRLIETRREPMQDFSILDVFKLIGSRTLP